LSYDGFKNEPGQYPIPAAQGNDRQESGSFLTRTGNRQRKIFFEIFSSSGKK